MHEILHKKNKKKTTYKIKTINTTNQIKVQSATTALQDTGIKFSVIVFGNQAE